MATVVRLPPSFPRGHFLEVSLRFSPGKGGGGGAELPEVADYAFKVLLIRAARRVHGPCAAEPDLVAFWGRQSGLTLSSSPSSPQSDSDLAREACRAIVRVPDEEEASRLRAALTLVSECAGCACRVDVLRTSGLLLHLLSDSRSFLEGDRT
jgi:hypothetical protein